MGSPDQVKRYPFIRNFLLAVNDKFPFFAVPMMTVSFIFGIQAPFIVEIAVILVFYVLYKKMLLHTPINDHRSVSHSPGPLRFLLFVALGTMLLGNAYVDLYFHDAEVANLITETAHDTWDFLLTPPDAR